MRERRRSHPFARVIREIINGSDGTLIGNPTDHLLITPTLIKFEAFHRL